MGKTLIRKKRSQHPHNPRAPSPKPQHQLPIQQKPPKRTPSDTAHNTTKNPIEYTFPKWVITKEVQVRVWCSLLPYLLVLAQKHRLSSPVPALSGEGLLVRLLSYDNLALNFRRKSLQNWRTKLG
ncbi:hypothetical protein KC19_7G154000 [Ceratodon purpureus]|uniref:Uncharacterized protein n=1 Tax=Ceratodon purpureus TaxID=3225 RepID=A0A8T0H8X4_CERPU|nr:hypothetical protein KC19_7G154000 [Ceratodon purpureus]